VKTKVDKKKYANEKKVHKRGEMSTITWERERCKNSKQWKRL